jgi:hypothetical protein
MKKWAKVRLQYSAKDSFDLNYVRIVYARYAGAFIVGIIGNEKLAAGLKAKIVQFLKQELKLDVEQTKTKITHYSETVPFLGYKISTRCRTEVKRRRWNAKGLTIRQRRAPVSVKLLVDIRKVLRKLSEQNFCTPGGQPRPNWLSALESLQAYSVSMGAAIVRGLATYYRLASNFKQSIRRINYVVTQSLAKTFAAKFKLQSRARVFAKAGLNLGILLKPAKQKIKTLGHLGIIDEETENEKAGFTLNLKRKYSLPCMPYRRYKDISEAGYAVVFTGIRKNKG